MKSVIIMVIGSVISFVADIFTGGVGVFTFIWNMVVNRICKKDKNQTQNIVGGILFQDCDLRGNTFILENEPPTGSNTEESPDEQKGKA